MCDELGHECHIGVITENWLLHQVDSFLREGSGLCEFLAALAVFFAQHGEAAWAPAVVECAHLRAGDERVTLVPQDDVKLFADGFVDHVNVHPGAA